MQKLSSSSFLSKNTKIKTRYVYRTIILPVVLYGCETWSLTLRDERGLRLENRVLRRIFGPKRDEATGEWRKVHNEERNDLYCSPSIDRVIKSRRMGWAGHVVRMGERRGVYSVLVGKPEGKRPLGSPRRRLLTYLLHGAESFLRSQLVLQLVKKFPAFLEPQGSSPYSQLPATCPYP